MEETGLRVVRGTSLDELVRAMSAELSRPAGDPFAMELAISPGPAHHRYLSQTIAGTNGFGVCSGIEFVSMPGLRRRLRLALAGEGLPHPDEDPWASSRLSRLALRGFDEVMDEGWAAPLVQHLRSDQDRPGRRLNTGRRVARLANRYCRDAPGMIDAWDAGDALDEEGHALGAGHRWQAAFWKVLCDLAQVAHPLAQHRELLKQIRMGRPRGIPATVRVLCVDALHPHDVEVLEALAAVCAVKVWQLDHSSADTGAVLQRLARVHAIAMAGWRRTGAQVSWLETQRNGAGSVLEAIQAGVQGHRIHAAGAPSSDQSFRLLPSHGPNRQVEVLRDHLCGLFEDDPTLEPRDVAVLCPDLDGFAAVLDSAMVATPATDDAHPAHWLRVSVSHERARQPNEVLSLLDKVLALRSARATWQDLFDLCLATPVATRWGFDGDGGQQLKQLIEKGDIRWGLDRTHRGEFGISWDRGTWLAGMESLALGAALADSPLTAVQRTAPAGFMDSQETARAGQLAEFVSRIRKFFHECQPATAFEWNQRLQGLISDVVAMPRSERWQVAAARAALAEWAGPESDDAILGRADVRQVIAEMSREQRTRPSFGTGSLVVTGLGDLTGIPHRVVVVLGLDDSAFPSAGQPTGDDVLAGRPQEGVPDRRELDQQHLLNALMSATEKFVVTYQAQDPTNLATMDQPVAVSELLQGARAADVPLARPVDADGKGVLPAQPFSRENFLVNDGGEDADLTPFSFDQRSFRAFHHLQPGVPAAGAPRPEDLLLYDFPPAEHPRVLRLQDLTRFFRHPIREFLTQRAGVSLSTWDDGLPTSITLESNGLSEYQVRETMLDRLRRGEDLDSLVQHQLLHRAVAPTSMGQVVVERAADSAHRLAARLQEDSRPVQHLAVDVLVPHPHGDIRLVGAVQARGEGHLQVIAGRMKGQHVIEAWVNALALACATGRMPSAVVEDPKKSNLLTAAKSSGSALEVLSHLVALYVHGMTHPLAAPPKALWAFHESGPQETFRAPSAWRDERDESWKPFTHEHWEAFMTQTTCSAGHDGRCSRVSTVSLAQRLFGSLVLEVSK